MESYKNITNLTHQSGEIIFQLAHDTVISYLKTEAKGEITPPEVHYKVGTLLHKAIEKGSNKARWLLAITLIGIDDTCAFTLLREAANAGEVNALYDDAMLYHKWKDPSVFTKHRPHLDRLLLNKKTSVFISLCQNEHEKSVNLLKKLQSKDAAKLLFSDETCAQISPSRQYIQNGKLATEMAEKIDKLLENESLGMTFQEKKEFCSLLNMGIYLGDARVIFTAAQFRLVGDEPSMAGLDFIEKSAELGHEPAKLFMSELYSLLDKFSEGKEAIPAFFKKIKGTEKHRMMEKIYLDPLNIGLLALKKKSMIKVVLPGEEAFVKLARQFNTVTKEERNKTLSLLEISLDVGYESRTAWACAICLYDDPIRAFRLLGKSSDDDFNSHYTFWLMKNPDKINSELDTIHKQTAQRLLESSLVSYAMSICLPVEKPPLDHLDLLEATSLARPPQTSDDGKIEYETAKKLFENKTEENTRQILLKMEEAIARGSTSAQWFFAIHLAFPLDNTRAFDLVENAAQKCYGRALEFFEKLLVLAREFFAINSLEEQMTFLKKGDDLKPSDKMCYSFLGDKFIQKVLLEKYLCPRPIQINVGGRNSDNPLYEFLGPMPAAATHAINIFKEAEDKKAIRTPNEITIDTFIVKLKKEISTTPHHPLQPLRKLIAKVYENKDSAVVSVSNITSNNEGFWNLLCKGFGFGKGKIFFDTLHASGGLTRLFPSLPCDENSLRWFSSRLTSLDNSIENRPLLLNGLKIYISAMLVANELTEAPKSLEPSSAVAEIIKKYGLPVKNDAVFAISVYNSVTLRMKAVIPRYEGLSHRYT